MAPLKTLSRKLALSALFAAYLLCGAPVSAGPRSKVTLARTGAEPLALSEPSLAFLDSTLDGSFAPSPRLLWELLSRSPPALQSLIFELGGAQGQFVEDHEIQSFARQTGLTAYELYELRIQIVYELADSILRYLTDHPRSQVRLLGRDMDDVYFMVHAIAVRRARNSQTSEATALLERLKRVDVSRPVSTTIRSPQDFKERFSITDLELKEADEIAILDVGYEGTMVSRLAERVPSARNIQWYFVWNRAPESLDVKTWESPIDTLVEKAHPALSRDGLLHRIPDSFRVRVWEHQAKWNSIGREVEDAPTYVFFDVDDSILKEVSIAAYAKHRAVQVLRYRPSPAHEQKYRQRLEDAARDKNAKFVVHYRFLGAGEMESSIVVRPGFEQLFEDLAPGLASGKIKIFLTSNNDFHRTEAVADQVRIAGKTLRQWGAQPVNPTVFAAADGKKNVAQLRANLKIPPQSGTVFVDDIPENIVGTGESDDVLKVTPWDRERTEGFFGDTPQSHVFAVEDRSDLRWISDTIQARAIRRAAPETVQQLRVLGRFSWYLAEVDRRGEAEQKAAAERPKSPSQRPSPRKWEKQFDAVSLGRPNPFNLPKKKGEPTEFYERWDAYQKGLVYSTAQILGALGDREYYMLGRDSEWLLYSTALGAKILDEFGHLERLHSLVTCEHAHGDPLFADYLAQEGISQTTLRAGRQVLMLDVCYRGSVLQGTRDLFADRYRSQIQGLFLYVGSDRIAWSRVFPEQQSPGASARNPDRVAWDQETHMQLFEGYLPHYFNRSGRFEKNDQGRIVGSGTATLESAEQHLDYVRDMVRYWELPETQTTFRQQVAFWRSMRRKVDESDREGAKRELKLRLTRDALGEAEVRDFCDLFPGFLMVEDFGLNDPRKFERGFGDPATFSPRHPHWQQLATGRGLPKQVTQLFSKGEFRLVLEYAEKAHFPEPLTEAMVKALPLLAPESRQEMLALLKVYIAQLKKQLGPESREAQAAGLLADGLSSLKCRKLLR